MLWIYPVSICGQIVDLCLLMEQDEKARLHLLVNHVLPFKQHDIFSLSCKLHQLVHET